MRGQVILQFDNFEEFQRLFNIVDNKPTKGAIPEGAVSARSTETSDGQQDKPKKDRKKKLKDDWVEAVSGQQDKIASGQQDNLGSVDEFVREEKEVEEQKKGIDPGKIKALYEAGWYIKEIAEEMGCHTQTVKYSLQKQGVKLRKGRDRGDGKED